MTTLIPTTIDEVVGGMRERSGEIYGFGETITRSSIDHGFLGGEEEWWSSRKFRAASKL